MKKAKRFGRGGDILTGIGSILVGKALYDKYLGKDESKPDYSGVGLKRPAEEKEKVVYKDRPEEPENPAKRRALAASKGQPEMGEVTPEMKSDKEVKVKPVVKKKPVPSLKKEPTPDNKAPAPAPVTDNKSPAPVTDKKPTVTEHQKFLQEKAGLGGTGITTPGDSKKTEPTSKAGIVGGGSTVRSDKEKMWRRALEVQRQREEAEKSRYKKGGSVSSASKRADGIAQRGKTRGKVY